MADSEDLERPYFRAALVVTSEELTLVELARMLGREPDSGRSRDIGDPVGRPARPATHSWWSLELDFDEGHRGCYGLTDTIVGLGDELADRITAMAPRIAHVALAVEQHLDPSDPMTDGIHLEAPAIAWLARVGAYVDIDQYAKEPTFRDALQRWGEDRMSNLRELRWGARRQSRAIPVLRRLVPVGSEERHELPFRVWRGADEPRRAEANRLWDEITGRRDEAEEHAGGADDAALEELSQVAYRYTAMLSIVGKGGRASRRDLLEARTELQRVSGSLACRPEHLNLLAEVDRFLGQR